MGIDTPPVGLRTFARCRAGIEVDAHKDGSGVAVGKSNPVIKIDELIIRAQQDRAETFELGLQAFRQIQVGSFLGLSGVSRDSSGILSAMTGVNDDCAESLGARSVSKFIQAT